MKFLRRNKKEIGAAIKWLRLMLFEKLDCASDFSTPLIKFHKKNPLMNTKILSSLRIDCGFYFNVSSRPVELYYVFALRGFKTWTQRLEGKI